jgi:predicted ATP-dependent serine protease
VCVIDSVQTLYSAELGSSPGSVAQVREAAARLLRVAKEAGVAVFLVGHVTKDGAVAGPRVLEHLVDCVIQFEGDRYREHRILRATKNRFGSTNEIGVFEMTATGLVGVPEPSQLFGHTEAGEIGSAVACTLEGSRPILLEIQASLATDSPCRAALPPASTRSARDDRRRASRHAGRARSGGRPSTSPAAPDRRARRRSRRRARLARRHVARPYATAWRRSARSVLPAG